MARPPLNDEPLKVTSIGLDTKTYEKLVQESKSNGQSFWQLVRNRLDFSLGMFMLPILGKVPCGPLAEALEHPTEELPLTKAMAEMMGLCPGDFGIYGSGISMTSYRPDSIDDGSLIVFRPGLSAEGKVALCRVEMESGEYLWTVKRFCSTTTGGIELVDGRGNPVKLPKGAVRITPEAVKKSIIAHH